MNRQTYLDGDMLVQEYTCTLCGYSTRDFDDLKGHMRDVHGRRMGGLEAGSDDAAEVVQNGGPSPDNVEDDGSKADRTTADDGDRGREMLDGILKSMPDSLSGTIRAGGLLKCLFCGEGFGDAQKLMRHMSEEHGGDIQGMMMGGDGDTPDVDGLEDLLGDLGKITSMLLSQLGPVLADPKNLESMFKGVMGQQGEWEADDDGEAPEFPDLAGMMEIAMEMDFGGGEGMDMGMDVEMDPDMDIGRDAEDAGGEPGAVGADMLRECPSCGNYMKVGTAECPFCGNERGTGETKDDEEEVTDDEGEEKGRKEAEIHDDKDDGSGEME